MPAEAPDAAPIPQQPTREHAESEALGAVVLQAAAEQDGEVEEHTGLKLKGELLAELEQRIERAESDPDYSFSILFIDLDNFKAFNDINSHDEGDMLLAGVGGLFREGVRAGDYLSSDDPESILTGEAYRWGGDEFVVVLDTSTTTNGGDRQTKLSGSEVSRGFVSRFGKEFPDSVEKLSQEVSPDGPVVSASIGEVIDYERGESAREVLKRADSEMYKRKVSKKALSELEELEASIKQETSVRQTDRIKLVEDSSTVSLYGEEYDVVDTGDLANKFFSWARGQEQFKHFFKAETEPAEPTLEEHDTLFAHFASDNVLSTAALLSTFDSYREERRLKPDLRKVLLQGLLDYCCADQSELQSKARATSLIN